VTREPEPVLFNRLSESLIVIKFRRLVDEPAFKVVFAASKRGPFRLNVEPSRTRVKARPPL